MPIRWVVFDLGETLVDETRTFLAWADRLGVPRLTFAAVLGAVIARGGHHREVFEHFAPGLDVAAERARLEAAGAPDVLLEEDLYPDARPCLEALRATGLQVGIAGNQPRETADQVRSWDLPLDLLATSEAWGAHKPDPAFFDRLVAETGAARGEVLYVGDRLDNDVRAGQAAGLPTAFLRRGPWGHVLRDDEALAGCLLQLGSLTELPGRLAALQPAR